jgi:YHS domain-containing protein
MKNKNLLIAIVAIFSLILINNLSYGTTLEDPKCKCENCKCGDNCTGDCKTCTDCKDNCKSGKCEMEGKSSGDMKNGKCEMNNSSSGEIKERCCTKSSGQSKVKSNGEAQGVNDSAKICPVSGEKIEGAGVTFSYLSKEYTFCCENCVSKFKAEPMNYIKEQLVCPVMGEVAEKDISLMYNDTKYYFCCKPCIKKFNKEPEKYSPGFKGN